MLKESLAVLFFILGSLYFAYELYQDYQCRSQYHELRCLGIR